MKCFIFIDNFMFIYNSQGHVSRIKLNTTIEKDKSAILNRLKLILLFYFFFILFTSMTKG
jgi:hypothetical protein